MKNEPSLQAANATDEVVSLIETLHRTGQRLEELTAGEVDTVADRHGRPFLLRLPQEQLREIEAAKQGAILNALPAYIALLDTQGFIISTNETWAQCKPSESHCPGYEVGVNYLQICDNVTADGLGDARRIADGIRAVLAGLTRKFSFEYPCYSTPAPRWFLLVITPLQDERPNGIVVMHLDITEQRQAQDELRESQRRFSDVLGNVQLLSVMVDKEARITYCNDYLLLLTHWRRDEVIGRSWFEHFSPSGSEDVHDVFSSLLNGLASARHHESVILTRSGEQRLIRWNNTPLRSTSGEAIGVASIGDDITERKQAEDKMHRLNATLEQRVAERTAQLESINEELESFSYSVSHDLRAPLRHIAGFVKLLQGNLGSSLSATNLEFLNTISRSTRRMEALISDLLAFSRAGRADLQKTAVNPDPLVSEIVDDFRAQTGERNILWDLHPLPLVHADRALLRMVLVNLISNAVKFTGVRAKAKIEIGCAAETKDEVVIFVRDNGAGFNPAQTEKLFGVFQRLHSQSEFEGTGIGLSNVQRVIHRHGGRVWAEGAIDGGATFYFSLPGKNHASSALRIAQGQYTEGADDFDADSSVASAGRTDIG